MTSRIDRRDFLRASAAVGTLAGLEALRPSWASASEGLSSRTPGVLHGGGRELDLVIDRTRVAVEGRGGRAVTINGTMPGPMLRYREGDELVINVDNRLDEDTSIHWHGIILPNDQDGVPGVTFDGIPARSRFTYRFPLEQNGTYWYHSHSGFQEQLGHYAPLIIDPAEPVVEYDREHVILLSDWTFEDPHRIMARLKKHPDYYNNRRRTLFDFFRDAADDGVGAAVSDRLAWGGMRMMPSDIADITGTTYTYLVNGVGPGDNWTGLFEPGERVRLRFINASAATHFDVRIPGLPMTVVQADGLYVKPVEVDEFRISLAETFDVIVEPRGVDAYTVFAEAMDRSGFARGTLAVREGLEADVPARREPFLLTMADMGHGSHDGHGDMDMGSDMSMEAPVTPAAGVDHAAMDHAAMGHGDMLRAPGTIPPDVTHRPGTHGPANAGVAMVATSRIDDPGNGLGRDGWRVLTYADLEALEPRAGFRAPDREIELHLTGNMERYTWGFDGVSHADAEPIPLTLGERVRLTLINDTMMSHPIHLHGMWMELENGRGALCPRVHTVDVKPAEHVSVLFDADAIGRWAFHCHVMYHMHEGMFRVFDVRETSMADGAGS
jgi:CopA family copper-resistance protein